MLFRKKKKSCHSYPCRDLQLIYESLNSLGIWWARFVNQIQNDLLYKTQIIINADLDSCCLHKLHSAIWRTHTHNRGKTLTLALNPRRSWAVCLKLMTSGTVCVTMDTNSSTFPYCFTSLCRMTCHMYEYVSCRGEAIKRREARGRGPPTPVQNITYS